MGVALKLKADIAEYITVKIESWKAERMGRGVMFYNAVGEDYLSKFCPST